ncbi:hypothetical protein AB1Y20_003224 [Prymnesium parvum]|uniref:Uncharacterized protein n=1 Tax=Prymnesium parvum TaxID=97485 RepID=A0AB34JAY5_PRYPA
MAARSKKAHEAAEKLCCAAAAGDTTKLAKWLEKALAIQTLNSSAEGELSAMTHKALCDALLHGHVECVRLIVDARVDVNMACEDGETTALHIAARVGHARGVQLLLDAGAAVSTRIRASRSADDLPKPGEPSAACASRVSPLHLAAQNGHEACVLCLLGASADVDATTSKGYTPLHLAVESGHLPCAQRLIDANASAEARTLRGYTPLHFAAAAGRTPCVRCLLGAGAAAAALTARRCTPLHLACRAGHAACAALLLAADGPRLVHMLNADEDTALLLAADNGHPGCVQLLLHAKAAANQRQGSGFPLFLATAKGHSECVRLLVEAGAALDEDMSPLRDAAPFNSSSSSLPSDGPSPPHGEAKAHANAARLARSPARGRGMTTGTVTTGHAAAEPSEEAPDEAKHSAQHGPRSWLGGLVSRLTPRATVYSPLGAPAEEDGRNSFMELDMISP